MFQLPECQSEDIRNKALKKADDIVYKNLLLNTAYASISLLFLLIVLIPYWNIVHLYYSLPFDISRLIMKVLGKYGLWIFGFPLCLILYFACLNFNSWYRWQRKLENVLRGETTPLLYWVRLSEERRNIKAEYRQIQSPNRRFTPIEILSQTCADIPLGHKLEAALYLDHDWQNPLAIQTSKGIMLVKPKTWNVQTGMYYLFARWIKPTKGS